MPTRSSQTPLLDPFNEPEKELRRRRKEARIKRDSELEDNHFGDLFDIFAEMANIDEMSMDEYNTRNNEGKGFGVERPKIPPTKAFEIKGQFLNMIQKLEFNGLKDEDPSFHVKQVEEVADFFNIPDVEEDHVMLRLFPATLKGNAKRWLFGTPSGEINTWKKLKDAFLLRYSPPSMIVKKKAKINTFEQEDDETLYDAWNRYKKMLIDCPQHDLNSQQEMTIFYNGLNRTGRSVVDSQGPLTRKNPIVAKALIEDLAHHSQQWDLGRDVPNAFGGDLGSEMRSLITKVEALNREVKKQKDSIHAIQIGCDNCGGGHLTKDCPKEGEVNEVNYVNDVRKPRAGWKPYEEYIKEKEVRYRQNGPGYYEKKENGPPYGPIPSKVPPILEDSPEIKDVLARFADASEKRHAAHEEVQRNHHALLLNLEKQIGQIAKVLQERPTGTMPSFTEDNPNKRPPT